MQVVNENLSGTTVNTVDTYIRRVCVCKCPLLLPCTEYLYGYNMWWYTDSITVFKSAEMVYNICTTVLDGLCACVKESWNKWNEFSFLLPTVFFIKNETSIHFNFSMSRIGAVESAWNVQCVSVPKMATDVYRTPK